MTTARPPGRERRRAGAPPAAAQTRTAALVAARARSCVEQWCRAVAQAPDRAVPFPFGAVTTVVRRCGTADLAPDLVGALVRARSVAAARAGEPPGEGWFTARWLDCLTSPALGRRTYETYTMSGLIDEYCRAGAFLLRAGTVNALLVGDLVRHELRFPGPRGDAALAARRATAVLHLAGGPAADGPADRERVLKECERFLPSAARPGPGVLPLLLSATPLPATTEPDEHLFVRSVQSMELLASVAEAHARAALRRHAAKEDAGIPPHLHAVADALHTASRLFRVVITIDPAQFDRIRAATRGTGALQSRGFASLERLCRGAGGLRPETVEAVSPDRAPAARPSLADLVRRADTHGDRLRGELRGAAERVDREWLRWKRAHYGVVRKVIGGVPGTGGTRGLAYLRQHVNTPLLDTAPPTAEKPAGGTT
ncbi:hypothetical protein [Streptomyces sp. HB2AG]|uniref:hypothetical protein n=1 Tax=Streptomyces sp. HB2AG TaxID=2983400 RepID=UPI0022AA5E1F|nr:hypothetical protein [Streptomyces sp. HB2AG]MCZ2523484.1 hypothetical protein [Streptomyces sp. HB2AG]